MVTVEISTRLTIDDLLAAATKLPPIELTSFIGRLIAIQSQHGIPLFTDEEEQALLQLIEQRPLSPVQQKRLDTLRRKSRISPLSVQEQAELLEFVKKVESQNVIRVKALIDLAAKRGMTVNELMQDIGLEPTYA
jgi:hypothetical protein